MPTSCKTHTATIFTQLDFISTSASLLEFMMCTIDLKSCILFTWSSKSFM